MFFVFVFVLVFVSFVSSWLNPRQMHCKGEPIVKQKRSLKKKRKTDWLQNRGKKKERPLPISKRKKKIPFMRREKNKKERKRKKALFPSSSPFFVCFSLLMREKKNPWRKKKKRKRRKKKLFIFFLLFLFSFFFRQKKTQKKETFFLSCLSVTLLPQTILKKKAFSFARKTHTNQKRNLKFFWLGFFANANPKRRTIPVQILLGEKEKKNKEKNFFCFPFFFSLLSFFLFFSFSFQAESKTFPLCCKCYFPQVPSSKGQGRPHRALMQLKPVLGRDSVLSACGPVI